MTITVSPSLPSLSGVRKAFTVLKKVFFAVLMVFALLNQLFPILNISASRVVKPLTR